MMTRNLFEPTHGPGMPVTHVNAHGQMVYAPLIVGPSIGLNLAPQHVAYDPSDPTTTSENHYQASAGTPHVPVATRSLYFLQTSN
jgi:hypothetical protein